MCRLLSYLEVPDEAAELSSLIPAPDNLLAVAEVEEEAVADAEWLERKREGVVRY